MTIETVEAMMITIEEGDLPGKLLVALNLQTVVMAVDIAIAIKVAGVPIENAGESRKNTFLANYCMISTLSTLIYSQMYI